MTAYAYTGAAQSYVVPAGVNIVTIEAFGAEGATSTGAGGKGGQIKSYHAVTPAETLTVQVGGKPSTSAAGYNGGGSFGGGGGSDVRRGGTAVANRIICAGGGGAGLASETGGLIGGSGGYPTGGAGQRRATGNGGSTWVNSTGAFGGSTTTGGAASASGGTAGGLATGGLGKDIFANATALPGGGGGWYGGGGGASDIGSGTATIREYSSAGGGSSRTLGTLVSATASGASTRTGNGAVTIDPYVTPAPTITSPATGATIASGATSVSATIAAAHPLAGGQVQIEFQYANNSAFTGATSVLTALQATAGAVTASLPLAQGSWYIRARTVGDTGLPASAWTSTVGVTVAHKPVATPTAPIGGALVPYAATYGFKFTATDPYASDKITAYQVMLIKNDDASTILDTGKITVAVGGTNGVQQVLGPQTVQVSSIPTSVKGVTMRWNIKIWDKDDVASDWGTGIVVMQDPPTVTITNPTNLSTVTSGTPLIQWGVTGPNSASHQSTSVVIRDVATSAIVWSTVLTGSTTPVQAQPSSPVVANGGTYNVTVTYLSTTGMTSTATVQFTAAYVVPDPVYYTVSVASVDVNGSVVIDWSSTLPDADLVRWNVYRRLMPAGNWERIATIENVADTTYNDSLVPVGFTYMYNVTQTALRFGVEVEGTVGQASGEVTTPPRVNLASNPALTTNDNQWRAADVGAFINFFGSTGGAGTITRDATAGRSGGYGYKKTWTSANTVGERTPLGFIENGLGAGIYSAMAWLRASKKIATMMTLEFYDASDTYLDSASTGPVLAQPGAAGQWYKIESATAPANTDHIRVYLGTSDISVTDPSDGSHITAAMGVGDWFSVDSAVIVAGPVIGPWATNDLNYFDGASTPPSGFANEWLGVANASRSRQYQLTSFAEYRTVDVYSEYFWIIGEQYPELSVRLPVAEQSETEEYESASYGIIGRGRHRDYGTRWGYTGSLTVRIRKDERISSTRRAVEALRQVQDTYWLRTPFGKLFKVAIGDLSWSPLAGVGNAEMGDLVIPYEEVA